MLLVFLVLLQISVLPITVTLILLGLLTKNVMLVLWTYFIYKVVTATIMKTLKDEVAYLKKEAETASDRAIKAIDDVVQKRKTSKAAKLTNLRK